MGIFTRKNKKPQGPSGPEYSAPFDAGAEAQEDSTPADELFEAYRQNGIEVKKRITTEDPDGVRYHCADATVKDENGEDVHVPLVVAEYEGIVREVPVVESDDVIRGPRDNWVIYTGTDENLRKRFLEDSFTTGIDYGKRSNVLSVEGEKLLKRRTSEGEHRGDAIDDFLYVGVGHIEAYRKRPVGLGQEFTEKDYVIKPEVYPGLYDESEYS